MKQINDTHVAITQCVKDEMASMPVVLPVAYGKLYKHFSLQRGVELAPEELLSHEMLDEKVVKHVLTLSQCTHEALEAMQDHDETRLQKVIAETEALRRRVEELQALVYTDTLTQCFSRKWFEDHFLDTLNTHFTCKGTLVMVDLNRFKRINDEYGHGIGDKVLVFIAHKLKVLTPYVVRFGGDEFLLNFDDTLCEEEIETTLAHLFQSIESATFKSGEVQFKISLAYGMCAYSQESLFFECLGTADKAMYALKKGRRLST